MSPVSALSRKFCFFLVCLIATQSNSSKAQFAYGVAGSPTPVPTFATGLPVFSYPRPVLAIEFDDAIQWASDKKTDAQEQAKEAREKAKVKQEAQRREADKKREAEEKRVEAEKKKKQTEASKRKNEESELSLREPDRSEPDRRERAADVWDRDLPTERPRPTEERKPAQERGPGQERGPHQGRMPGAPDATPELIQRILEMRELRERRIREFGPNHPSIQPLNAALEEFERRQQGPRPEPPRQPNQGRGPQERGPQEHGPQEHGPREHSQPSSVDELMHAVERLDHMIERLANEYHAIDKDDADQHDADQHDDDQDADAESRIIREKIREMVELRLTLRQRVKRFQLDMMRLELERATMETELYEQSLEAIHAVTVEEILHR